ncbi:MAG: hypothetical protein JST68_04090 [Bacteroidetes bacterium]|nr:hypothetical protein [Bacteroidota bacterium]
MHQRQKKQNHHSQQPGRQRSHFIDHDADPSSNQRNPGEVDEEPMPGNPGRHQLLITEIYIDKMLTAKDEKNKSVPIASQFDDRIHRLSNFAKIEQQPGKRRTNAYTRWYKLVQAKP